MKKFIYSLFVLAVAAMTFSGCEDVPAPYNMPQEVIDEIAEPSGSGTAEDPYNAVAANQLGASLDADASTQTVYVKGIVSRIDEVETEQYGNAIFYISEDGTTNNQFYVFHCYGLGGERFTSEDELKVGDEVIVCGQITNFRGNTVELAQGGYIYSLNGTVVSKGESGEGEGTLESPYNVAKALEVIAAGAPDEEVYVKGKVSEIKGLNTQYHSLSYYISDDGTTAGQLYIFGGKYLNNEGFTSEDQLKVGDEVVIRGKLVLYGTTSEMDSNNVLISVNGQTEVTPGTEANPYSASQALEMIASGENDPDAEVYIKGKVSQIKEVSAQHGNATYYISDDGTTDNQLYVFRGKYFNGENFTSEDQLKVGDEVVILGKLTTYNGDPQVNTGSQIVSLTPAPVEPTEPGLYISGNTVTIIGDATAGSETATLAVADITGLKKQDVVSTLTMSDGSVITFDKNGGRTDPAYYDTDVRVYSDNIIHFSCKKNIAKIVFTCAATDRVGETTATFTIDGTEATYTNVYSKGTQLRITNIVVTYAK